MHILTFIVLRDGLAGVRQTSLFFHWQRIHIRAYHHTRPVTLLHPAPTPVTFGLGVLLCAETLGAPPTRGAQLPRAETRGACLVPGPPRPAVTALLPRAS